MRKQIWESKLFSQCYIVGKQPWQACKVGQSNSRPKVWTITTERREIDTACSGFGGNLSLLMWNARCHLVRGCWGLVYLLEQLGKLMCQSGRRKALRALQPPGCLTVPWSEDTHEQSQGSYFCSRSFFLHILLALSATRSFSQANYLQTHNTASSHTSPSLGVNILLLLFTPKLCLVDSSPFRKQLSSSYLQKHFPWVKCLCHVLQAYNLMSSPFLLHWAQSFYTFLVKYLFIWLHWILVVAHGIFCWGM